MNFFNYITDNALILIPVLLIVGKILKNTKKIADEWIPILLLPIGIFGAFFLCGWSFESVVQGVLLTGSAVYGNQIVKQIKKSEE